MKKTILISLIIGMTLMFSVQTDAALQLLGTDSLGNRLIYDTDFDITWYDYTNAVTSRSGQYYWAANLSVTFGSNTYDDWRLPSDRTPAGQPLCQGTNCTGSELGHLFYTELGNSADTTAPYEGLQYTGYFQNLQNDTYWLCCEVGTVSLGESSAFTLSTGYQGLYIGSQFGIAVRDGLAVVPEPISSILFVTGGTLLAGRSFLKRNRS